MTQYRIVVEYLVELAQLEEDYFIIIRALDFPILHHGAAELLKVVGRHENGRSVVIRI